MVFERLPEISAKHNEVHRKAYEYPYESWIPAWYGAGSMTVTGITLNFAHYCQIGKTIFFEVSAIFTTGGVANTDIAFVLPISAKNAASNKYVTGSALICDTSLVCGIWYSAQITAWVRKYDGSNWGLGSDRQIHASGFYEVD
jgi:hypothetical protein